MTHLEGYILERPTGKGPSQTGRFTVEKVDHRQSPSPRGIPVILDEGKNAITEDGRLALEKSLLKGHATVQYQLEQGGICFVLVDTTHFAPGMAITRAEFDRHSPGRLNWAEVSQDEIKHPNAISDQDFASLLRISLDPSDRILPYLRISGHPKRHPHGEPVTYQINQILPGCGFN